MTGAPHSHSQLSATALLALLVAVFGTLCGMWIVAGLAAVVLGVVALGEITVSQGRQHGRGLAVAGIVLGTLHLAGVVALIVGMVMMNTAKPGPFASPSPVLPPVPVPGGPGPTAPPKAVGRSAGAVTPDAATRATRFGPITLVDPGGGAGTLATTLNEERERAVGEGQTLMLFISSPDCQPCAGVGTALADPRLQTALDQARIVRLDLAEYAPELARRGIPVDVLPSFVLLTPDGEPLDYVNGSEWDADIPENIAPVLGNFIHNRYTKRRNPWRGRVRRDETAL